MYKKGIRAKAMRSTLNKLSNLVDQLAEIQINHIGQKLKAIEEMAARKAHKEQQNGTNQSLPRG